MNHIDLDPKTDRELLIMVVNKCNETHDDMKEIKGTLKNHEGRITSLERYPQCESQKLTWKSTFKVNWQTLSLLASLIALIILELVKVP